LPDVGNVNGGVEEVEKIALLDGRNAMCHPHGMYRILT